MKNKKKELKTKMLLYVGATYCYKVNKKAWKEFGLKSLFFHFYL